MSDLTASFTLRCGLVMPDRIAMAPLTNTQSHSDGTLSDDEFRWLMRRAEGGFRWISTCAAFISDEGHAWDGQLGISSDAHLEGLTRLATALREAGSVAVVQLHHAGAKATMAADKLSTGGPEGARAATEADLDQLVEDFTSAAVRAEKAGFAGVEIHGANGYVLTQFLAPEDNPRTDAYGGSLENRARIVRRVVQSVRAAVSPSFAVGIRISPVDTWARRGLVLADSLQLGRWLVEDGIDFLHLSLRDAGGSAPFEEDGPLVATAFREALPEDVAIFAAGGIWTRADAERALAAGVDVVVLGRASIGNPDWPTEVRNDGYEPLRTPWEPDHLRSVAVGEDFLTYITPFPGMVVGGKPARG